MRICQFVLCVLAGEAVPGPLCISGPFGWSGCATAPDGSTTISKIEQEVATLEAQQGKHGAFADEHRDVFAERELIRRATLARWLRAQVGTASWRTLACISRKPVGRSQNERWWWPTPSAQPRRFFSKRFDHNA